MDTLDNSPKNTFKTYYDSLNNKEKASIRNEFLKESGRSYPAFYSKLKHRSFTKLELKELSKLSGIEFIE